MQTTLEDKNWFAASRFRGVMRYNQAKMSQWVLWTMAVLAGAQLLSLLMSLTVKEARFSSTGVSINFPMTMLCTLICAHVAAKQGTRFLLRFGTPRTSVWLGNVLSLMGWMLVLLFCTLVLSVLTGGAVVLLNGIMPDRFLLINYFRPELATREVFSQTLADSLSALPQHALWVLEWSCLFYLLSCCMRRNKGLTIGVIVGVPLLLFITMLIPAIQQTLAAVENADNGEIMLMGLQWYQWLMKAAKWVMEQWPWIQLLAALVSLPLSWLCMRTTAQP